MGTIVQLRDSLYNFVNGLGTAKDSRMANVYNFDPLARDQLEAAYRSDWIARRVITAPADDATREWRDWQASQDQISAIEDEEKRLDVKRKLRKALVQARLYGGSAIVLGTTDGNASEPLDPEAIGKGGLKWIAIFHQFELTAGQRILDIESEWFNRPEYYEIAANVTNVDGKGNTMAYGIQIHPSRVIPLIGNDLPDERIVTTTLWGDSVLQSVDDAIKSTQNIIGGISSMVVDAKMDVINIPGLSQKLSDPEGAQKLIARFMLANQAKSSVNSLLLDEKETWNRKQTQFGSLPNLVQEYLTIAAGASGIPVSRLLGMAKGKGLGGTEGGGEVDTRNYYDSISSVQRNELSPVLAPLDDLIIRSALGSGDDSIFYEWTPLWQMSDTEKAAIALQKAQASQLDVAMALINPDALREARINQLIEDGTYPGLADTIDEYGSEPPEPETPSPEDLQNHIGMMQKSAQQLQMIGKTAALPPPTPKEKPDPVSANAPDPSTKTA